MSLAKLSAAGLLIGAAWMYSRQTGAGQWYPGEFNEGSAPSSSGGLLNQVSGSVGDIFDYVEGAMASLRLSNMRGLSPSLLDNANVKAFLRVIRTGEGTADEAGYRRIYGGQMFTSFADHPRIKVTKGGWTSTAAGAYQALASTWDETKRIMGLPDFSPRSQDLFALGRIAARGALDDVLAGRFPDAIRKTAWEWASLPGSPYGQPVISWDRARSVYAAAGGVAFA